MHRTLAFRRAPRALTLQAQTRPFSLSSVLRANEDRDNGKGIDDQHSVNKVKGGNEHGQHEQSVKEGMKSGGDNATGGKDAAGGKDKAKKEFPESPDPGMGMQDERGGKGA